MSKQENKTVVLLSRELPLPPLEAGGAIGQAVARRAAGFDMQVCYTSRSRKADAEARLGARFVSTPEALVQQADIVSLHVPLTPETRGMVDAALLAKFRSGAVLVNTGRGPLVDEKALAESLASGHVSAAGLDVFEHEPDIPEALIAEENAFLTPHIGSATEECRREIVQRGLANIIEFLEKGTPLDRV